MIDSLQLDSDSEPQCKDMTYLDFPCSRILLLELWLIYAISGHYDIMIIYNYTNNK